jgi:hypothetical protein
MVVPNVVSPTKVVAFPTTADQLVLHTVESHTSASSKKNMLSILIMIEYLLNMQIMENNDCLVKKFCRMICYH